MYTFLKSIPRGQLLSTQLPSFFAAFLIAEFFYKFKSFALECIGFLVTWYVLDAVLTKALGAMARTETSDTQGSR